jgi:hypothetical protein
MAKADLTVTVNADALLNIDLHTICVMAVNKMVEEHITRHVSFIGSDDDIKFGLKEGGKIPKVVIEWVDASEALPENQ